MLVRRQYRLLAQQLKQFTALFENALQQKTSLLFHFLRPRIL